jgi:hypothetical protein
MVDKDVIRASLEAINEVIPADASECHTKCCCPKFVIYLIWTNCVTINNGACPDWDFCEPSFNYSKG